ncbi:trans-aconitate 2-methyltransferase [Klebsiella pneumoniae]|nr:trans-aconitate 2-methyltransferase [Klebsiella pneumoniae]
MADWNPSLYLQFDAERTRPAADLLSRIAHLQVEHAVDLGCGPGNSTRLLGRPGRAGRKRVSHTLSRIAGRTLSVTV